MCGIAGIFSVREREITPALLNRMADSMRHRGPDDEGYLLGNIQKGEYVPAHGESTVAELRISTGHLLSAVEVNPDFALCHRRLSILDLSSAGHQPMSNEDGTMWIVHNGEIYNHLEINRELTAHGHYFHSRTDTETILHSYEQWGADCLKKFNGMWAFAIWDGRQRKLFCSRDRFGIKPFYYYFDGERFIFASEIKAILEAPLVERKPNAQTVFDYLAHGLQDCTEDTFFSNIMQLTGGHLLEFDTHSKRIRIQKYYDVPVNRRETFLSDSEYSGQFLHLFEDSIRLQLVSDVPVGSCLSGGLDSSSIVCMIDKLIRHSDVKLPGSGDIQKTFSAKFHKRKYDESYYIDKVVEKTGVDTHVVFPLADKMWANLPNLIWHQEEPCAASYVNNQWQVYHLARQSGVTVVLDGQGGDELLAGYSVYYAALLTTLLLSFKWKDAAGEALSDFVLNRTAATGDVLQAVYNLLPEGLRLGLRKIIRPEGNVCLSRDFVNGNVGYYDRHRRQNYWKSNFFETYLRHTFTYTNLPRLLRDLDKNSMAHSVESRPAFLDYRLVEFAFSLPWHQKVRRGSRKFILRNAMKGILPESVATRMDKVPFPRPAGDWLKEDFVDEVLDILNSRSFIERGYFNSYEIEREFAAFRNGRKRIGEMVWRWVNLELWHRMFIDKKTCISPGL